MLSNINNTSGKNDGMSTRYEKDNGTGCWLFLVLVVLGFVVLGFVFTHIDLIKAMIGS